MPTNIEYFSVFAAEIFSVTYDKFPMPVQLFPDSDRHIDPILLQEHATAEAKALGVTMAQAHEGNIAKPDQFADRIRAEYHDYERRLKESRTRLRDLFTGTVAFLEAEGYIRKDPSGAYDLHQLTAKGFTHLNKRFTDAGIVEANQTFIQKIKSMGDPSTLIGNVASGAAVSVVSKLIGG